jgi:phosphatidylglycerol:prolipoprotein diacylglycerol transferase
MLNYIQFPDWLKPEIIPGLPLRWYSLMYIVGFVITYLLFIYQARKRKMELNKDDVLSFFFWGIIGLILGARIFAALFFDPSGKYWSEPWLIFWPFGDQCQLTGLSGMNYYGGLLGAIVAMVIYARRKKIDVLEWGDMLIAGLPIAYSFGRVGNFINGELFGRITTWPWGMYFPSANKFPTSEKWVREFMDEAGITAASGERLVDLPRHPTQIYEWFFEGMVLWLLLWFIFRKRKPFKGFLIAFYIIGYGVVRFVIDYLRIPLLQRFSISFDPIDDPLLINVYNTPFNFTMSQIFSFLMIIAGSIMMYMLYKKSKQEAGLDGGDAHKVSMKKLRKKIDKEK